MTGLRHHFATGIALAALACLLPVSASAAEIPRTPPPTGALRCGETALVDDGACGKNRVTELTGGCNLGSNARVQSAPRTKRCAPRP